MQKRISLTESFTLSPTHPYPSIIEQNAGEIRKVIEQPDDERPWVLEHHSSLEPEKRSKRMELAAENWDAPIIFTTMVQFLEALFGGGSPPVLQLADKINKFFRLPAFRIFLMTS